MKYCVIMEARKSQEQFVLGRIVLNAKGDEFEFTTEGTPYDSPGSPKLQMDISPASSSRQVEIDY